MEGGRRTTFILQAIQLILPKLEVSIVDNAPEAIELARLVETLISNLEPSTGAEHSKRGGDVIDEKLYQLFQVSIRGISLAIGNVVLRESFYNTCAHYLSRITSPGSTHKDLRRHSQQTIKTSGAPLIEAVCDDAYAGQETCRVSAFLLLNLLATLDSRENSFILADAISQSNYLSMFLDTIKALPSEFRSAQATGESGLLLIWIQANETAPRHSFTAVLLQSAAFVPSAALSNEGRSDSCSQCRLVSRSTGVRAVRC